MCVDKDKQTLGVNYIKGEENTSITSEKKEKVRDGYFQMYECGNQLLYSTYEHVCASQDRTISMMK